MAETIKKYLKYNILCLILIGFWTKKTDFFKTKYYSKYAIVVNVFFMGLFNFGQILNLVFAKDLQQFLSDSYLVTIAVMANVKAYFYLKNWKLFRHLIDQLDHEVFQPVTEKQHKNARGFILIHNMLHGWYMIMGTSLGVLWLSIPFLDHAGERKLPFKSWYPYDWSKQGFYEFSYVHQSIGIIYCILTNANLDVIIISLAAYTGIECDILSNTLKNLHRFSITADGKVNMEDGLIRCIFHHRKILKFAEDTNVFFKFLVFAQFAASLMSICITMFELSVVPPSSTVFLVIFVFQMGCFTELLLYCWFGNEVISKSSEIPNSIYESHWIDASHSFKRNMLFFIRSTQRPIRMYTLNFFELSLATFIAVLHFFRSVQDQKVQKTFIYTLLSLVEVLIEYEENSHKWTSPCLFVFEVMSTFLGWELDAEMSGTLFSGPTDTPIVLTTKSKDTIHTILRSSWSFFAMLHQVNDKNV